MSGRHSFSELTKEFTPERRRIKAMKNKLLADMPLHELRRARAPTQQELAETLNVSTRRSQIRAASRHLRVKSSILC